MSKTKVGGYYLSDILSPKKWWWLIQGKLLRTFVSFEHCEKVVYASIVCDDCMENGKCLDCSCPVPEKMLGLKTYCSKGKWDNSKSDKEWREFKKKNGITFKIEYN